MAAEPIIKRVREEAATAAAEPRRLRSTRRHRGSGATTAAIAVSAALHGALAATILMWPEAPAPLSVGDSIVVSLVAEAPAAAGRAGAAGEAVPTAAEQPVKAIDRPSSPMASAAPLADSLPPLPAAEPPPEESAPTDLAIEPASGAATPPPSVETPMPPAATWPSETAVTLSMVRPLQRPVVVPPRPSRAEPSLAAVRPTGPAHRPSPDTSEEAKGSAARQANPTAGRAGGESAEKPAHLPPPADNPAAAGDGNGAGGPVETAALGSASIGPVFAMGSALNPRPRYPLSARRRGLEGRVVLRVFVEADGRVRSVDIVTSSTHPVLDTAAVEAIAGWRFDPARRSGVAVAAWIDIPVAFRLRE